MSDTAINILNKSETYLLETALVGHDVKPFSEIGTDQTRAIIDKAVAQALGLPDISILRTLLSREPILCLTLSRLQAD